MVKLDTRDIMALQSPEHWIPVLGNRIQNMHLKEFSKEGTDFSLAGSGPSSTARSTGRGSWRHSTM